MTIIFLILLIIFALEFILIFRLWLDYIKAPKLSKICEDEREMPFVSLLIPVRNEEKNISHCLNSLINQDYPNYEIIIIDDNSEDRTYEISEEYVRKYPNIKLIKCPKKPEGWLGKSYALHCGVREAKGEFFGFIDADVSLSSQALSKAMYYILENKCAALSFLPTLKNISFWEKVIQPVMGFMIIFTHPIQAVNNINSNKVMANGQFMLFNRDVYFKIGGHESIKGEIVEDVELAKRVKSFNLPYQIVLALEDMQTRMYDNLKAIWQGWGKSIYPYIKANPIGMWIGLLIISILFLFPFFSFFTISFYAVGNFLKFKKIFLLNLFIVIFLLSNAIFSRKFMNQKMIYGLFFPLALIILLSLFLKRTLDLLRNKGVVWKGRIYK